MSANHIPEYDSELVELVRIAIHTAGVRETARRFGLHPQTVLTIAAGAPVRRGSLALVRAQLGLEGWRSANEPATNIEPFK